MFWTILLVAGGVVALLSMAVFFLLVIAAVRSDMMVNKFLVESTINETDIFNTKHLNTLKQDEREHASLLNAG